MCDKILVEFGRNLRRLRMSTGMSQEGLAHISGLHRTYISSVERGKRNISLTNINKLADSLNVPVTKLIIDEN
jgi:transcriptional regulator with XRE-family HTH domain